MDVQTYRRTIATVEAVQVDDNEGELMRWVVRHGGDCWFTASGLVLRNHQGTTLAEHGSWIVLWEDQFYAVSDADFAERYEPVSG